MWMASVLVQLLPEILGAMLSPIEIIVVLTLLVAPRGVAKAIAFVLGMTLVRLIQGVLFGYVFDHSPENVATDGGVSPIVATLLLLVGVLLLITAYRTWRKVDDPDAPPPQWMQSLDQTTPVKAFLLGGSIIGVNVKQWVFTLTAIGIISEANLALRESTISYLLFVLLVQTFFILSLLICALAPKASAATFQRAIGWLTRNNRAITIIVCLVFGTYFTWSGISGLLK
jgi:threonine/homoserine/homoserine lactone efflux protein